MRYALFLVFAACTSGGPPWSLHGSARLPACDESPAFDLTGRFFDQGMVAITSAGCEDIEAPLGSEFPSCALDWEFTQTGNDVRILVDSEYWIDGRLCGDQLHFDGGWWLPVEDDKGCTYSDDDAAEVVIEAEGAVLTALSADELEGTLVLRAGCTASYDITLQRSR